MKNPWKKLKKFLANEFGKTNAWLKVNALGVHVLETYMHKGVMLVRRLKRNVRGKRLALRNGKQVAEDASPTFTKIANEKGRKNTFSFHKRDLGACERSAQLKPFQGFDGRSSTNATGPKLRSTSTKKR